MKEVKFFEKSNNLSTEIPSKNGFISTPAQNQRDFDVEENEKNQVFGNYHLRIDDRNWSWSFLRKTFRDLSLGDLYDRYVRRLQNAYFNVYLMFQVFFSLTYSLIILLANLDSLDIAIPEIVACIVVASFCISIFLVACDESVFRRYPKLQLYSSGLIIFVQVVADLSLSVYFQTERDHPRTQGAFATLIIIYIFVPIPKLSQAISFGLLVSISHLLLSGIFLYSECENRTQRIFADIIYYACGNAVGIFSKLMSEVNVRRAFLDRRGFINSTIKKNYEKDQEEQLLLSILPKHISIKVKNELLIALKLTNFGTNYSNPNMTRRGSIFTNQNLNSTSNHVQKKPFSDLFVERHENVTILFSDIVNFTPLTVLLNAVELVSALNELFGRFDQAAKAHDCLRIKLLGDCYYCVSGLPNPTKDHAKNCIQLGFEMIEIIKDLRERLNVNIAMRIGVHSGNILSGLLGIYKWQFDIWSKDVNIANYLEKTGVPGMIHITRQTKDILGNEYNYIPSYGKLRDKYLLDNNIETFLIKSSTKLSSKYYGSVDEEMHYDMLHSDDSFHSDSGVLNTLPENSINNEETSEIQQNNHTIPQKRRQSIVGHAADVIIRKKSIVGRTDGDVKGEYLKNFHKMMKKVNSQMEKAIDEMPLRKKDQWCGPSDHSHNHNGKNVNPLFMTFHPLLTEVVYQNQPDPLFKFYVACSLFVLLCIIGIQAIIMPSSHKILWIAFSTSLIFILILIPFVWISYLWMKIKDPHMEMEKIPEPTNSIILFFYKISNRVSNSCLLRILIFIFISVLLSISAIIDVIECDSLNDDKDSVDFASECKSPWYFTYSCTLAILGIFGFLRMHFLLKGFIVIVALGIYSTFIFQFRKYVFDKEIGGSLALEPFYSHLIYLVKIALLLHIMDRQMEYINRLDFIWKRKLDEEHKEASITHAINTILIHNILPMKIAKIYMDPNRSSREGHSRNYKNVSVMFASISNFMNSYTETDFSDQGIKWLQLLNEIIVEFDQVLFDFVDVEKIKVIGSTYMCACGLEVQQETSRLSTTSTSDTLIRNWRDYNSFSSNSTVNLLKRRKTLHILVQFAACMMSRLEMINKNAFQEFELRIGINCGAVVAGVIGATQPAYDLWSDTVNCASRFETTSLPGKIQIPEECAKLLMLEGVECERRGPIKIKGKPKPIVTYFVSLNDKFEIQYIK